MHLYELDSIAARSGELIAANNRAHLEASLAHGRLSLLRRAARPLGRSLVWLGGTLLRYGMAERAKSPRIYRQASRSAHLN